MFCKDPWVPPNRARDLSTSDMTRAPFGYLIIRRTFTNHTGAPVTRLRFRIVEMTTFPSAPGISELRAVTAGTVPEMVPIVGSNPACPLNLCLVEQTTLEQPPAQPLGGGMNASLSINSVAPGNGIASSGSIAMNSPIQPGGAINVRFLLGVAQTGYFRFYVNIEAESEAPSASPMKKP